MFKIYWSESAFDEMQAIISSQTDLRTDIIYAMRQLRRELIEIASTLGESREGTRRVTFVRPLIVSFDVDIEDKSVEILWIRLSRKAR